MNKFDRNEDVKHSSPISINPSSFRRRSTSISSSSSGSGSSPDTPGPTPTSIPSNFQPITIPSPSSSPILSYFLAQSPTKTQASATGTFPFKRKFGSSPVFEEEPESEVPVAAHTRRTSAVVPGRFLQNPPVSESQHERGKNLLRRLSLGGALNKPIPSNNTQSSPVCIAPPNSAVIPPDGIPSPRGKHGRSATISSDGRKPHRAPSPMGERILKGHFDGFN
jgi:hypothetical protein